MNIISRVQFPNSTETSDLYIKCDAGAFIDFDSGDRQVALHQGSTVSLNTYFNSIYEKFYAKYTTLSLLYYSLSLNGDFEVSAYREFAEGSARELIHSQIFKDCHLSDPVVFSLPELKQNQEAGRIYLELTCLSEQGAVKEGVVLTEQEKHKEVSLGVITCTFKKEVYVKKTVNAILQDKFLEDKSLKVFVVDNGKTLTQSDFEGDRIKLISNRNVGGSGGFTKGLIDALQEDSYTHFLFMDDDIELDSEAIYRLFSLYEYAKQDFAVAGSMLDLYKKHLLHESGSIYNKHLDHAGNRSHSPFSVSAINHNLDLSNSDSLNLLQSDEEIDFGGFWFFAFSREVVESIGLPLPFFIKVDDIEFNLRIKEHLNGGIVAFPSLAVWHEPFYAKKPVWDVYYNTRNHLITDAIHSSLRYFSTVRTFTKNIIYYLMIFDYNAAQMYVKAFEDYMQGPSFIKSTDPESFHSIIYDSSRSHQSQTILTDFILDSESYQVTQTGKLQKLLSLLTLNGSLLPKSFLKDESVTILHGSAKRDSVCKGFGKKRVIFVMEKNPCSYQNDSDNRAAVNILLSWLKFTTTSGLHWASVSAEWKKAAKDLTSIQFWQSYLESNEEELRRENLVRL
jgi:galactofuranosylgalactofuranosylrhamnosyl-N-acetylglucosaminyl-diphospho-decaprenol beta-1,5/1,6-galactofuranosyltransferase